MLDNRVFELVLNMVGVMGLCIWNGIVYDYVIWIVLLNGSCVCYSDKHNGWYRALSWYQILYGDWVSALGWSQIRFGVWVERSCFISNTIWYVVAPVCWSYIRFLPLLRSNAQFSRVYFLQHILPKSRTFQNTGQSLSRTGMMRIVIAVE